MSARKKNKPFVRAPYALHPRAYAAPVLVAMFIIASALFAYQAPLVGGYMRAVGVVGQVQGDSYRALGAAALAQWKVSASWFLEAGQKAEHLKSGYINTEK